MDLLANHASKPASPACSEQEHVDTTHDVDATLDGPQEVRVCTHWPISLGGPRITTLLMEVSPKEKVGTFLDRYRTETENKNHVTLCVQGQARGIEDEVAPGGVFEVDSLTNTIFIHIRVEDERLEAEMEKLRNGPSMLIPLDEVRIKDKN